MALELGKVEKIDPRTAWEIKDRHFAPWLAEESNIALVSNTQCMSDFISFIYDINKKQSDGWRRDLIR